MGTPSMLDGAWVQAILLVIGTRSAGPIRTLALELQGVHLFLHLPTRSQPVGTKRLREVNITKTSMWSACPLISVKPPWSLWTGPPILAPGIIPCQDNVELSHGIS